jgi:hypothetical protein
MKKVIKDNETYYIDCTEDICGNCNFIPLPPSMMKCKLFGFNLDHAQGGLASNSGWWRCYECKNAEVK